MGQFVYNENSLSTSSLVLASMFLVCGAVLRKTVPLSWDDIYSSLDAYIDGAKARTRVTFHFQKAAVPAGKIYAACLDQDAELKFEQSLESGASIAKVSEAHANAEVRLCYARLQSTKVDLQGLNGNGALLVLEDSGAEEKFAEALKSHAPKATLIAAHGAALSAACAEAIRARLYLVSLMRDMPQIAKWDVIDGDGGGAEMVRVGKEAGNRFRAEWLSRL
jgi:hypothetical protein